MKKNKKKKTGYTTRNNKKRIREIRTHKKATNRRNKKYDRIRI